MKPAMHVLLLAGLFSAGLDLQAVLMKPFSIAEISQSADLIVHGRVVGKTCHRDEAGRIYTKIELNVLEFWKGTAPGSSLIIFQGGGTMGNERVEVSGEAEYQMGEEVVAFLVLNPRRQPITFALGQGKFHVWQDKLSGEKFANNLFQGAPGPTSENVAPAPDQAKEKPLERLKLKELKQRVQGGKL